MTDTQLEVPLLDEFKDEKPDSKESSFHHLSDQTQGLIGTYLAPNDVNTPQLPDAFQFDRFPSKREDIDILSPPRKDNRKKYSQMLCICWCAREWCDGDYCDTILKLVSSPILLPLICCCCCVDPIIDKKNKRDDLAVDQLYQDTFMAPTTQVMR